MKGQLLGMHTHTGELWCWLLARGKGPAGYHWKYGTQLEEIQPQSKEHQLLLLLITLVSLLGQKDKLSLSCFIKGDNKNKNAELLKELTVSFYPSLSIILHIG